MENEPTTKTPIPPHRESLSCLLSSVFCLLSSALPAHPVLYTPSCPLHSILSSTLVETPLQIALFSAKQSQFQSGQNEDKYSNDKGLCQRTTNNDRRTLFKTNPIKPNSPAPQPSFVCKKWGFNLGHYHRVRLPI